MLNLGSVSLWFSVYFIYLQVLRGQEGELLARLGLTIVVPISTIGSSICWQ
jgi:hypothetical protein